MKLKIVLRISTLSLMAAASAHSDPLCSPGTGTLAQCLNELARVKMRIQEHLPNVPPHLGEVILRGNRDCPTFKPKSNQVCHMNHYDAERYCHNQGAWLPSVRELALVSKDMGARGIRETAHNTAAKTDPSVQTEIMQMEADGYYPIYTINETNQPTVAFYFNYTNYQRPRGNLGKYNFWTSSINPEYSGLAYLLYGINGNIGSGNRAFTSTYNAVRCAR